MRNHQRSFGALGSEVVLTLVSNDDPAAVFETLMGYITDFEARFSRFKQTSELTKVNDGAGTRVEVSREFSEFLDATLELAKTTDELFNPLILPRLQAAGYKGSLSNDYAAGAAPQYEDRRVVSTAEIEHGSGWVRLPAETALDSGGIGKGYLLGRLVELVPKTITGNWFSLGGDIAMAGRDASGEAWQIGVAHALVTDRTVGSFTNDRGWSLAVATSGVTKRRGLSNGKAWHHIIDPRSGEPAETDLLTVTVACDDPTEADVLAKSAVIVGSAQAWPFLAKHHARGAILQRMGDNGEVIISHHGDAK